MRTRRLRLQSALVGIAAVFCAATPAAAQSEPPTIRSLAKSLARMNAMLRHCEFDAVALARPVTEPVMARTLGNLADALTQRAILLGVAQEDAGSGVARYMKGFDAVPPNVTAFRKTCTPEASENLTKSLGAVETDDFKALLTRYAVGAHYDRPFLIAGTQVETYASPGTQRRIGSGIATQLGACNRLQISEIDFENKDIKQATNLPIFVRPTIVYTETWLMHCDDEIRRVTVKHARDSEGPVGHYSVELTPAD